MLNPADTSTCTHQASLYSCFCEPSSSRRGFLSSLSALGASVGMTAALPGCTTASSGAAVKNRIDTHHHVFSPTYVSELAKVNQAPPIVRNWSLAKTMDDMDKAGVVTSIVSVTTPQVQFADAANAQRISRESNEWAAKLAKDHPGRFGSFIMLPLQDIDASLKEI